MWINWIYNHLSAKLSLSLYMRDCHCFFPVPFIFHQLWETEHTSVKIWGTQATEHPGTGGFQSDCNDRTKQTKHWPKSVGKWLVLFLQSKYCVFLPKKSQCFLARNRANLDAKKTWFPAFSPPLRLFLKQRAPRTYSTQNNPKHVVFTTRLRIFCFLLPLRHRVPQEFVCGVGTFRVEPVLLKERSRSEGQKKEGGWPDTLGL